MTEISPTSPSPHYKPQYKVSPEFRKFWEKMFPGVPLTSLEIQQLTDQFVKNVANNMNEVLNWALKEQKKREEERKKEE
ncbi:MAG: hypothetical protein KGQ49_03790 [Verrucomicrobia bacterium]|nr:hypothetical protein [Verrucomicrobiota bacterium]MBU6446501.1 hypothetical protein [Verrucomicrobiota bacterium]MDE3047230.1 hypothetical protein [Verrucomicrobiota bacterium]